MLAPFHLGKRDSGSKNIISINKLTNLFIKVIKNFLLLSPAGLCFPSLPTCLSHQSGLISSPSLSGTLFLCHYPAWPDNPYRRASFSVIRRLSRPHPQGAAWPEYPEEWRRQQRDCPIKSGNDIKQKQSQPAPSPSLSGILFLCHYPAWPDNPYRRASFSVIRRLSRPHPQGAAWPEYPEEWRRQQRDCPIKSGNDIKGIK